MNPSQSSESLNPISTRNNPNLIKFKLAQLKHPPAQLSQLKVQHFLKIIFKKKFQFEIELSTRPAHPSEMKEKSFCAIIGRNG